jgi:LPXTG-motif cell wall-anchored protein
LPKTASPLALLALIGAGGLGSAAFLRSRRRS